MLHVHPAVRWAALALTLAALGCSDAATLAKPDVAGAYSLMRVSGDAQQGTGGARLPNDLVVQLVDRSGNGVAGIRVAFSVVSGGGVVAPSAMTTDLQGLARTSWTLGVAGGPQQAQASVAGLAPVAFGADASVVVPEQLARTVALTPAQYQFSAVGDTVQMTAAVADSAGRPLPGATVHWTTLDPDVATVDATGAVVARANGHARIAATVGAASATANIGVHQVVTGVNMNAAVDTIDYVGDSLQLSAIPVDRRGNPVPVSQTWVSLDPTVATVDTTGMVTATGVGTTTVRAVAGNQYGSVTVAVRGRKNSSVASVSVSPSNVGLTGAGATAQLTAHAYDVNGTEILNQQFKWSSANAAIASVNGNGNVTAKNAGTVKVTASSSGVQGSSTVTVAAGTPTVAKVTVSPSSPTIDGPGNTVQLTATAYDGNNNALAGQTFTWTSSNPAVGTVNSSGLVTAVAVGTAQITATDGGVQGSASLSVIQTSVAVARLTVSPSTAQLTGIGSTVKLAAQAYDAAGNPIDAAIAWTSANSALATVDATGLVTARAAGTVQVTATSGTAQASASITVTVPVARVTVTPSTASLTGVGSTVQLTAQAYDASGNALGGQTFTWASSNNAVATVGSNGLVTAAGAGSVTITATDGSVQGSASVTVTVPPPVAARVTVTPSTASLTGVGSTVQLSAQAYDASGNALGGQTFTWASANTSVATVGSNGLVTAAGAGSATITAADGSVQGSASVTVTVPPPVAARVTVTPSTASLTGVGSTVQLSAQAYDASGNALGGQTFTWASSNNAVATVGSNGLVTAAGAGSATITATDGSVQGSATVSVTVSSSGTRTFSTNFPLTENPISQGGSWINGGSTGLDWSNVATKTGLGYGLQTSGSYRDATALLTGTWGPDQTATATVYSVSPNNNCAQEVELRLRSSVSAHVNNGYEISFGVMENSGGYLIIVRWNGALGDFAYLFRGEGSQFAVSTGDVVSASVKGNVISVYKNGALMGQATDNTFSSGSPGMGFNLENAATGCSGTNQNYGFTSFSAHD